MAALVVSFTSDDELSASCSVVAASVDQLGDVLNETKRLLTIARRSDGLLSFNISLMFPSRAEQNDFCHGVSHAYISFYAVTHFGGSPTLSRAGLSSAHAYLMTSTASKL